MLASRGIPAAEAHPAAANFMFGNVRLERVHLAPDAPAALAGRRSTLTTIQAVADFPTLMWKGIGAMGGKLGLSEDCLRLAKLGVSAPSRPHAEGHYILSVTSFDKRGVSSSLCELPSKRRVSLEGRCCGAWLALFWC